MQATWSRLFCERILNAWLVREYRRTCAAIWTFRVSHSWAGEVDANIFISSQVDMATSPSRWICSRQVTIIHRIALMIIQLQSACRIVCSFKSQSPRSSLTWSCLLTPARRRLPQIHTRFLSISSYKEGKYMYLSEFCRYLLVQT